MKEREVCDGDWGMGQVGREMEERVGPVRASRHTVVGERERERERERGPGGHERGEANLSRTGH